MMRQLGKLIVISAPSGCGKTTITNALLRRHPEFRFSVSATTRPKRNHEKHGEHYYFLTREEFEGAIGRNDLVEWEEIYGNLYGSLREVVERALNDGQILLFDVDVKGGLSIKLKYPSDSILIFINPPSLEELQRRLAKRNTESAEQLQKRLERVPMELEKGKEYDYAVVNDNLDKAIEEVDAIVHNELNKTISEN
jgi:guanylate kinase